MAISSSQTGIRLSSFETICFYGCIPTCNNNVIRDGYINMQLSCCSVCEDYAIQPSTKNNKKCGQNYVINNELINVRENYKAYRHALTGDRIACE